MKILHIVSRPILKLRFTQDRILAFFHCFIFPVPKDYLSNLKEHKKARGMDALINLCESDVNVPRRVFALRPFCVEHIFRLLNG